MEIWLNPACSKCRAAVSLLDESAATYTVRRYLDDPPTAGELTEVLTRLGLEPWDITRTGESVAGELGLAEWPRDASSRHRWIGALAEHPILIQRPIITADDGTTVVGRSESAVRAVLPRPRSARSTVRVLMIDTDDRLLLFQDSDPGNGVTWWILPGGGIDPGETQVAAVLREVAEETGHRADPADVVGPLATREVLHGYTDKIVDQHDTFYAVRVTPFDVSTAGHTDEEQLTMLAHRWWTRAELAASDEEIWPAALHDIWDLVADPQRWPLALAPVEESSVAVQP